MSNRLLICTVVLVSAALPGVTGAATLWGPQTYVLTSLPQTFTSSVPIETRDRCNDEATYLLSVSNGTGSSGSLVSSGTVSVNGTALIRMEQLPSSSRNAVVQFLPSSTNALTTTLSSGKVGSAVTVSISKTAEALVFAGSHALSSKSGSFRDTFAADSAFEHVLVVTSGSGGTPKPSSLSVTVNGVEIVRAGDVAYYAARRQISVGAANILDVTMRGTAGATVAIAVMRVRDLSTCPPFVGLAVTSPSEGETVSEPLLPVTGTAFGPAEIHVYVNGESALLERNHAGTQQDPFPWSTDLWIKPGATTVTAAAVIAGPTAPVEIRRAVAHEPPPEKARITAAPQNGTAPLTVSYSFSDNFDDADSLVDVDFEGDGTYDVTHNGYPEDLTHIYATAGTYEPSVRATRIATGEIFTAATTVRVESIADVDTAIRAQWSNFLSAVSAADVDAAMTFMTAGAREKYRPILESTAEHLPGFAASIVSIGLVTVDDTTAKYVCSRTVDGVERGHWVVFQKDDDGFWKILQF